MVNDVLEAIDRPIRDLVVNINRIGLQTVFSCCGFSYDNEEEPKSHAQDAFVIFKEPNPADSKAVNNFFLLTSYALRANWKVSKYHTRQWAIRFEPTEEQKRYWSKPSLHDYELHSIAIFHLNKVLNDIESYSDSFTIVDGNAMYHKMGIHWQIQPKLSVTVKAKLDKIDFQQEKVA